MNLFGSRLIRVLLLDKSVFEAIRLDPGALPQAILILILSGLSTAIGLQQITLIPDTLVTILTLMAGWVVWTAIVYLIGMRLKDASVTDMDFKGLLCVLGFTNAPGVFRAFAYFYHAQNVVLIVTAVWMLAAMVIAIKQALRLTIPSLILLCILGWILQSLIGFLLIRAIGIVMAFISM